LAAHVRINLGALDRLRLAMGQGLESRGRLRTRAARTRVMDAAGTVGIDLGAVDALHDAMSTVETQALIAAIESAGVVAREDSTSAHKVSAQLRLAMRQAEARLDMVQAQDEMFVTEFVSVISLRTEHVGLMESTLMMAEEVQAHRGKIALFGNLFESAAERCDSTSDEFDGAVAQGRSYVAAADALRQEGRSIPRLRLEGLAERVTLSHALSKVFKGEMDMECPPTPRLKDSEMPSKLPRPGRYAATPGFLLPVARELRFRQQHGDKDTETKVQKQQQLSYLLLATWEEEVELRQQAIFWNAQRRLTLKPRRGSAQPGAARGSTFGSPERTSVQASNPSGGAVQPGPARCSLQTGAARSSVKAGATRSSVPAVPSRGSTQASPEKSSVQESPVRGSVMTRCSVAAGLRQRRSPSITTSSGQPASIDETADGENISPADASTQKAARRQARELARTHAHGKQSASQQQHQLQVQLDFDAQEAVRARVRHLLRLSPQSVDDESEQVPMGGASTASTNSRLAELEA